MTFLYSIFKRSSLALFTASIVATFAFTACSSSKKKNKENNQTVNTTATNPQPAKAAKQQASRETAHKNANTKAITAKRGHKIIQNNGCLACHSTNGKRLSGPTFKNLYRRKTTLKNGKTIIADSAYIAESIKDPRAKIVKGFSPVMPRFSYLKDEQIASIIAYIKSISK